MAQKDAIRREREIRRAQLQAQKDQLENEIANRGLEDRGDLGDFILRQAQDGILQHLNEEIRELDEKLAGAPDEDGEGGVGSDSTI